VHRGGKLKEKTQLSKLDKADADSERVKSIKPQVVLKLIDTFKMDQVLIFCRTNLDCDLMEQFLRKSGGGGMTDKYTCRVLAGMRSVQERRKSLEEFKEGEVRILVATDVAARGIDIKELPFVINVTTPDKPETYVHRIGRVGRAERMGLAISIVSTVKEKVWFCRNKQKPPVSDTRLFNEGGNCIWYDEPKLVQDIERLMKDNKVSMAKLKWPGLQIPADIAEAVTTGKYGRVSSGGSMHPATEKRMKILADNVSELVITEFALQSEYWKFKDRFKK